MTAELDLVPEMTEQELARYFLKRIQEKNASCQCLEDLLLGFFPDKLIVPVLKIAKLSGQMRVPDMDYALQSDWLWPVNRSRFPLKVQMALKTPRFVREAFL